MHALKPRSQVALFTLLAVLAACQTSRSATMPTKILARSPAPLTLGSRSATTPLAPLGGDGASLATYLEALAPGRSLYLVARGLTSAEPPGVTYTVYLDLPAGATPTANDPRRIGSLNFYNAGDPAAPIPRGIEPFYSFDLTAVARALRSQGQGQLAGRTTVTLIPQGAPNPKAEAVVGRFELVEQ
jgi:hypothetical protein